MPKLQSETVIRCSADTLYEALKKGMNDVPPFLPEEMKNVQIVEGDGMNPGTAVRHWRCEIGGELLNVKEKIEDVDDENRSITAKVIGGDFLNLYRYFHVKMQINSLGEDECSLQLTMEFEKAHELVPTPNEYLSMASMALSEMALHLN